MREVDGIEVGSAVLPIQNQHPMQMAQRALTLNMIAGGRFILGLGMTHQAVTEGMWGIPYDKPVRRMREYLDALQPLLAGEAGQRRRRDRDGARSTSDRGRAGAGSLSRGVGPADAEAVRASHGGHADVDVWTEDARRPRRSDAARGGRGGRSAGGFGPGGGRPADQRHRRRRGRTGAGRRAVRDLRIPAVLSRDARPRGVRRTPRTPRSSATRKQSRIDWTSWLRSASTKSPRSSSTALPEVRERTRALLLSKDS